MSALTLQQKKNRKAIELMFQDLDDEYLKTALLCAYAGEDEAVLDEIVSQQRDVYMTKINEMKIENVLESVIPEEERKNIIEKELNSQYIIDVNGNQTNK